MAAPRIVIEFRHVLDQACPQRIQVNIPYQFQEIWLFFADYGFVAILEKMPGTPVALVKGDSVAGKQPTHENGELNLPWTKQEMKMVGH
jgi:cytochrome c biogenesis protein ResB